MYRKLIPYLLLASAVLIYMFSRNPHVSFGDSLGFLVFAVEGWDLNTNATSHFLYNNLNHVAVLLFPHADPIAVLTLFSALFASLCLIQLYRTAYLLSHDKLAAAAAAVATGLGFTFWRQAVIIEVYSFHCLLLATLGYFLIKSTLRTNRNYVLHVSVMIALCLLCHIQSILLLPLYFAYLVYHPSGGWLTVTGVSLLVLIFSPLILLPLILDTHDISAVFFDTQYQDAVLQFNLIDVGIGFLRSLVYLIYNFHLFLFFIIHGAIRLFRGNRPVFWGMLMWVLPIWFFAMRYNVSDNYVFFLGPYLAFGLLISFSLAYWLKRISRPDISYAAGILPLINPLVYALAILIALQLPQLQSFEKQHKMKGGIAYYLWPGQRNSEDPLALAHEIFQHSQTDSTHIPTHFDRYEYAIRYLKNRGTLSPQSPPAIE